MPLDLIVHCKKKLHFLHIFHKNILSMQVQWLGMGTRSRLHITQKILEPVPRIWIKEPGARILETDILLFFFQSHFL